MGLHFSTLLLSGVHLLKATARESKGEQICETK